MLTKFISPKPPKALWEFAEYIGPATDSFYRLLLKPAIPQELLRIGLGLKKLATQYLPERLKKVCERVTHIRVTSYVCLDSILKQC